MDPTAPGWKTTEFYKALIPQVLALLAILHVVTAGDASTLEAALTRCVELAAAFGTSATVVWQYIASRTALKVVQSTAASEAATVEKAGSVASLFEAKP